MEYQNFNLYGYKNFILSRQVLKKKIIIILIKNATYIPLNIIRLQILKICNRKLLTRTNLVILH